MTIRLLTATCTGFVAGIGACEAVLKISGRTTFSSSEIVRKADIRCYVTRDGVLKAVEGSCSHRLLQDDDLTKTLDKSVRNYFASQDWIAPDPGLVIGIAKSIVRRFEIEVDVFAAVNQEIEKQKREDANWTFANRTQWGLMLVHALGLSPKTKARNEAFLMMVPPHIEPKSPPRHD